MKSAPEVNPRLIGPSLLGLSQIGRIGPFPVQFAPTAVLIDTDAAETYTPAQVGGGFIQRECGGGNRTDVTPTGTELEALLASGLSGSGAAPVGTTLDVTIHNISAATRTLTVGAGVGVTIQGTATQAQGVVGHWRLCKTATNTFTLTRVG
jgi:hypothetical protein